MRGDRPFTYMAASGKHQQGDQARAYAVVMSLLQECDDRQPRERFLYAQKESVYATLEEMPTLEVMVRQDIEERRRRRQRGEA